MINTETERIRKAIDAIKKERPDYGHVMDVFGNMIIKQSEFLNEIEPEPVAIAKDAALAKLKKGIPLLDNEDIPIDLPDAFRLFKELCEILKFNNEQSSHEIGKIESALEEGDLDLEEILTNVLIDDRQTYELAESLSLDGSIVVMLAVASVKPWLEAAASHLRNMVEDGSWSERCCPVCGSAPTISELRQLRPGGVEGATTEGAERILYCSFCGNEWRAMRLACPFCGNTRSRSLRYLYAEGDEGYRIDVCEKCKKYIKTVDSRKISHEIVPAVEDIATLHLDVVAEEEGYKGEA